jgi:hypothetical protein
VIVATRFWRFFLMQVLFVIGLSSVTSPMIWDNRYFPWFDQLYTGSDSRHGFLDLNGFFIASGDSFRFDLKANKEEQVVSVPELWGMLNIADVGTSMTLAGLTNPIPQDWQWLSEFTALMPSSIQGQGVTFSCYAPFGKHFGIGANGFIMQLNSFVCVLPTEKSISKLNLSTPGNQALFTQMMNSIYNQLGIIGTSSQQVGVGDVVLYAALHDTHEYKYKFRKLDWGLHLGVIIPSGLKHNFDNLASVPLGSEFGLWGWFAALFAEFELKEDWKCGIQGRLTQRIDRCFTGRIPIGEEQPLFAPIVGSLTIDSGMTGSLAPYVAFEDLRAGFGVLAKYTISMHEKDLFSAHIQDSDLIARMQKLNYFSGWTQEFATIKLFYDIGHDKNWEKRPFAYFAWDIPMNHIAGRGFAKTNRVSLGCTVNF